MKIYKITSPNTELVYVGKTIRTIEQRLRGHYSASKRYARGLTNYCSSFKVLECGDAVIELLEEIDGETDDARRETFWINELNACNHVKMTINMSDPVSVAKYMREYREANRDAILEMHRKYREGNKDALRERALEKVACDNCGRIGSLSNMARHKKTQSCINNPLQNHL